ncbi:MAG: ABC-2 transporter permease [Clostridium sp.]|nr:ABC-2 transporter permease [Clostridium sp.]
MMKGLLLKDFYLMRKTCKIFFIVVLVMFAAACFMPEHRHIYLYCVLLMGLLPQSLLGIEELDSSDEFNTILPVSKKQLVKEKYVLSFLLVLCVTVLIAVLELFMQTAFTQLFVTLAAAMALGLLFPSISLPFMLKYGHSKSKIILMCYGALIGVLCACFVNNESMSVTSLMVNVNCLVPLILIAVTAVVFVLSYLISVRVYQKREM